MIYCLCAYIGSRKIVTMKIFSIEITEDEVREISKKHFVSFTPLVLEHYPRKLKKKAAILSTIKDSFEKDKYYTEKEVNGILKSIYDDYVTIRRDLYDAGLIDREKDGSKYWRNKL